MSGRHCGGAAALSHHIHWSGILYAGASPEHRHIAGLQVSWSGSNVGSYTLP